MQANLIYNPNSGSTNQLSAEELVEALAEAGFHPIYKATGSEEDLDPILRRAKGLVVVAGGDGTVRAVATRLIGKRLPLALIPLGTANNIWKTFSSQTDPRKIIESLKNPTRYYFDIGSVRSPWGQDYFLESFGLGLYADTLAAYEPEKGKSVIRSISALVETLGKDLSHRIQVWLDGEVVSGEYLLFEVLNTTAMGPRIKLAPRADPTDGLFDVVRIHEKHRDGFLEYLSGLLTEELDELPSVEVSRARRVEILCEDEFPFHVDAEVRPEEGKRPADQSPAEGARRDAPANTHSILVEVLPQAIELWLPQPEEAPEPVRKTEAVQPGQPPPPPLHSSPL